MNLTNPIFLVLPHHIPEQICDHLIFLQILIMFHLLELPCTLRKGLLLKKNLVCISLPPSLFEHFHFTALVYKNALTFLCVCGKALPIKCQNEKKNAILVYSNC